MSLSSDKKKVPLLELGVEGHRAVVIGFKCPQYQQPMIPAYALKNE
jgi:hypothetical protein